MRRRRSNNWYHHTPGPVLIEVIKIFLTKTIETEPVDSTKTPKPPTDEDPAGDTNFPKHSKEMKILLATKIYPNLQ